MRNETGVNPADAVALPVISSEWEKDIPYTFGSIVIVIEHLAGDKRIKCVGDGIIIKNEFPCAYGRILGTTDLHAEEIDCYIAFHPELDGNVFVIDQINPATGLFDEHKVMLGFRDINEVFHTYSMVFSDESGPLRVGNITTFTPAAFNEWIDSEGSALRPASTFIHDDVTVTKGRGIAIAPNPGMNTGAKRDEVGGVQVELADLSKGPRLKTVIKDEGCFEYHMHLYGPLKMDVWSNPIDVFCRVLNNATDKDVMHIHIACPGGSVILMGRMLSSIDRTAAKVIVYAEGMVASAATGVWCAGHERHIAKGATFMQHMSSQGLCGKTTDIQSKAAFSMAYIQKRLDRMQATGLFTEDEIRDMVEKSADIYVSGRDAIARVGAVSHKA